MIKAYKEKTRKLALEMPEIDWQLNMGKSIAGQILNNEECKKDPLRVLGIAAMVISDILRYEND